MNEPLSLIMQAADFAARRHAGQRRKGVAGEPYVNHLLEVAALLAEATGGNDAALVAAALLHDTLEDTATEYEELDARFGPEIAALVAAVTDDKSLPKAERKRRQIASARAASARAKLLKIADKTSNVRALVVSPPTNWDVARGRRLYRLGREGRGRMPRAQRHARARVRRRRDRRARGHRQERGVRDCA
jgi:(p)ppGpp synthase/HD superfamily hydrolase